MFTKRTIKHKIPPTHKISSSYRSKHVWFFLHVSEESITKKLSLKEISVAVIVVPQPMGCARGGRCRDPKALAHTRRQVKYTSAEHVHSRGMNIRPHHFPERDGGYFLLIWIDSRLPHIRNRVTQRLIWLLKIEGLFVGMLFASRFPGLLAHWVFFGDARFGTTTDGKRGSIPFCFVIINRMGYWN